MPFTPEQLDQIAAAAKPLPIENRDAFAQEVANALSGAAECGPGNLHRAIASVQRHFWDPPDLSRAKDVSKYR